MSQLGAASQMLSYTPVVVVVILFFFARINTEKHI